MKRLVPLLVVVTVLIGAAGCGGDDPEGGDTSQFTQGGVSMEPTVRPGQVVTVRSVGSGYRPKRGDIVLFRGGPRWGATDAPMLKRVIAVGGETVACCDPNGQVTVNGEPLAEPYVAQDAPLDLPPSPQSCESRRFDPVTVPADSVFVMGDNRAASNDSRCVGPVPATAVSAVLVS